MNKRILSVIVFSAALLSVQAQDGKGGISPAMLGRIQQSYRGTPSDKALRNAIGNNDIRKLALNQEICRTWTPISPSRWTPKASPIKSLPAVAGSLQG